jgi:hypothetical protein
MRALSGLLSPTSSFLAELLAVPQPAAAKVMMPHVLFFFFFFFLAMRRM